MLVQRPGVSPLRAKQAGLELRLQFLEMLRNDLRLGIQCLVWGEGIAERVRGSAFEGKGSGERVVGLLGSVYSVRLDTVEDARWVGIHMDGMAPMLEWAQACLDDGSDGNCRGVVTLTFNVESRGKR
eukprot:2694351-Rhodomonas_salina.2